MNINWKDYITINPGIMFGKAVIIGTRVPVDLILEKLSTGETMDQLLEAYPKINKEALFACLKYA